MIEEELATQSMAQIRSQLAAKGADFSRTEKKQDLIHRLMVLDAGIQPDQKQEVVRKEDKKLTPQEINEAVKHLNVEMTFDDTCWTARHNHKLDCGNLKMPLSAVVRCCEFVAR